MEKFCLTWNDYEAIIKDSFKKFKVDQRLFDVTLVTDDGQHIQAHKIILSAGSNFFSDIFMKSNHSNMLVYLKGISSDKLNPIIDFIFNGEAFIAREELKVFIETGKELQVQGLEGELTGVRENTVEKPMNNQEGEHSYDHYEDEEVVTDLGNDTENTVAKMDEKNLTIRTNTELDLQINEMIEKNEGVWRCKICGKTATTRTNIRTHTEIHIEGMSHDCHICSKTFTTRMNLSSHIYQIHSKLFSFDVCDKTGMTKAAYRMHNKQKHN